MWDAPTMAGVTPDATADEVTTVGSDVGRALVEEAARRSSVLWVRPDGADRARPAWHVWHDGAAYLVVARQTEARPAPRVAAEAASEDGASEQLVPGLAQARAATVICRAKDSRARLVTWRASVTVVAPDTPEWQQAVEVLRGERLNATNATDLPTRWSTSADVIRLTPTGEILEEPGRMPTDDGAAPPPPTPATTVRGAPWVIHRRPRHRPRLS